MMKKGDDEDDEVRTTALGPCGSQVRYEEPFD
jgi:hypothetical protein